MLISVIIPCRNEAPFIGATIDALFSCTLPEQARIKVHVVDGMSDDGTRDVIREKQAVYPNLFLVDNEQQLTPFAFNLGIFADKQAAYYQIVGARHVVSINYLMRCIDILENDSTIWCVGGKINNVFVNETGRVIAKAMSTSFGMGLGNFRTLEESGFTDTVTSPMYPNWVFDKIGYFDEELIRNQDDDFNYRVKKAGGKIYYCHEIHLDYFVRGNKAQLWKQFMQYGYWKVFVNKKHQAITTLRQLVPPAFVFFLCILPLFLVFLPRIGMIGLMALGLYVSLALFVAARIAESMKEWIQLLQIFPMLHVSYGWGYLKGMVRFLILNKPPKESSKSLSR
jgi:GT2 family glycosyltransferase